MPHRNTPVRRAGLAEINELVAQLYTTTPDVADEVRELLQAGLQRRDGGISLPPRLLDRVVSGPDEQRATLRDWIMPITQRINGPGRIHHATPAPQHGSPAHQHGTPAAHHAPRRTSRHGIPVPHREAPSHHHHHGDRHATPAPHHEAPLHHHTPRHTSRHVTPGHYRHHGDRHPTPAHHEAPVAHHAPRHMSRHGTPGHHHGGRQGTPARRQARHEAPVSYIYEPVDSMGDQNAVPRDVLNQLARPIVTQSMIDSEDATCVICQEDIKVGDEVMLLPCSHWSFHATCIEPWLRRSNTCPSCRQTIE